MRCNPGGYDYAAAAHRFDAAEVKAFSDARAHRGRGVAVQHPKIGRRNGTQHEQFPTIDPGAESLHGLQIVPAERAYDDQLQVRISLGLDDFPGGQQARVVLARLDGSDAQEIPEGLVLQIAAVEALLLPEREELRPNVDPLFRVGLEK